MQNLRKFSNLALWERARLRVFSAKCTLILGFSQGEKEQESGVDNFIDMNNGN